MLLAMMLLFAAPPEPTQGDLNAAIWSDLQLNAWIGSGNIAAQGAWYFGDDNSLPPTLTIVDLDCHPKGKRRACTLDLERTPHPKADPEREHQEARRLTCKVEFWYVQDGKQMVWKVVHKAPEAGGHSVTLLQCKPATM